MSIVAAYERVTRRRRNVSVPPIMPASGVAGSYGQGSVYISPRPLPGLLLSPYTSAPTEFYFDQVGGWPTLSTPSRTPPKLPTTSISPVAPAYISPVWPRPTLPVLYTPLLNVSTLPPAWELGTFPPEPFGTPVPLRVHPHLIYNPLDPIIPVLQWDIVHQAEQAKVLTGRQVFIPPDLDAEAVIPHVRKIWIYSDHPTLATWMETWGPIMIKKSAITVCDVLDAIYDYFQKPLTRRDVRRIKEIPGNEDNLIFAAHQRVCDSYELLYFGLTSGFRRADVMGCHRRFQGLRAVVYQDNSWRLFLGLLPGPAPRFA